MEKIIKMEIEILQELANNIELKEGETVEITYKKSNSKDLGIYHSVWVYHFSEQYECGVEGKNFSSVYYPQGVEETKKFLMNLSK